jgi:hypothetical protein
MNSPYNIANFSSLEPGTSMIYGLDLYNEADRMLEYIIKSDPTAVDNLVAKYGYKTRNQFDTVMAAKEIMATDQGIIEVLAIHPDKDIFKSELPALANNTATLANSNLANNNLATVSQPATTATVADAPVWQKLLGVTVENNQLADRVKALTTPTPAPQAQGNSIADVVCVKINLLTVSLILIGAFCVVKIIQHYSKKS